MAGIILSIIDWIFRALSLLLLVDVILGYFVHPYNPIRKILDGLFNPMLKPFRKVIPSIGGLDISPIALMLTFWLLDYIIHLVVNLIR